MVIATLCRLPSPNASTTSAGTSTPVALPAGTTVARKVLAFKVLSLGDADDVARRVGPNGISGAARLGDGLLPHLDARWDDDPVEGGGEVVPPRLERTQSVARHPACERADDGDRGEGTWRCEHDIEVGLVVRDERDDASTDVLRQGSTVRVGFRTGVALGSNRGTMRLGGSNPDDAGMTSTGIQAGTLTPAADNVQASQPRPRGRVRVSGFGSAEQRFQVRHLVIFRAPIVGSTRPAAVGAA
jgi:hypothetical protein